MTSPVMPAAPAARVPSTGGTAESGGAESAAPFASALDGALAGGRAPVGDGATGGGQSEDSEQPGGTALPTPTETTADPAAAVGLSGAVWALALGVAQPVTTTAADGELPVVGVVTGAPAASAAAPALPGEPVAVTTAPTTAAAPGVAAPAAAATALPPDVVVAPAQGSAPPTPATPAPAADAGTAVPAVPTQAAAAEALPATGTTASAPATAPPVAPSPVNASVTDPASAADPAVPATAPATAGGATPSGTGGADGEAGAGTGSGASAPVAENAEPTSFPVTGAAPATTASTDVDGASGVATTLPVAGQVARQVAVLRGAPDGSHTMTLVLTPETLGPVEVSVTVSNGTVDLVLRGAHEQGRAALLDALPDLRRDLESAGLTTSRMAVDRETGGSWLARHAADQQAQQGSGQRPGQQEQGDGRSRPWLRAADTGESRTVPTTLATSSGVDVRV